MGFLASRYGGVLVVEVIPTDVYQGVGAALRRGPAV